MDSKTKRVITLLSSVTVALFIVATAFLSAVSVAKDKSFYDKQFEKNETARWLNTDISEVRRLRDTLLGFLFGDLAELPQDVYIDKRFGELPFYTEDEVSHMGDVKRVFTGVNIAGNICAVLSLLGAAGVAVFISMRVRALRREGIHSVDYSRGAVASCSIGTLTGLAALVTFVGIIALAMAVDFHAAFAVFHRLFFPQGNWAFSPDSNMLTLLPSELFMAAAVRIIITTAVVAAALAAAAVTVIVILKKRNKTANLYHPVEIIK